MNLDNVLIIQATEDRELAFSDDKACQKKLKQEHRIATISDDAVKNESVGLD